MSSHLLSDILSVSSVLNIVIGHHKAYNKCMKNWNVMLKFSKILMLVSITNCSINEYLKTNIIIINYTIKYNITDDYINVKKRKTDKPKTIFNIKYGYSLYCF